MANYIEHDSESRETLALIKYYTQWIANSTSSLFLEKEDLRKAIERITELAAELKWQEKSRSG